MNLSDAIFAGGTFAPPHPFVVINRSAAPLQVYTTGAGSWPRSNLPGSPFWAAVLVLDIVWTGQFKRYWEHNPRAAARIREAADVQIEA